jgi:membrane protease YdiL (CAAX protease family)
MAYGALSAWAYKNGDLLHKLGLGFNNIRSGVLRGTVIGVTLGILNTGIILYVMPALGVDINFLSQTPHAQIPFWIMMPWFIILIAMGVELNFRGFLLGRLLVWFQHVRQPDHPSTTKIRLQDFLPLSISALTFSFDPFMVSTFRDLHWIAVWDGLVWGWLWMRLHNLYTVIAAHAVEVILLYLIIRGILT